MRGHRRGVARGCRPPVGRRGLLDAGHEQRRGRGLQPRRRGWRHPVRWQPQVRRGAHSDETRSHPGAVPQGAGSQGVRGTVRRVPCPREQLRALRHMGPVRLEPERAGERRNFLRSGGARDAHRRAHRRGVRVRAARLRVQGDRLPATNQVQQLQGPRGGRRRGGGLGRGLAGAKHGGSFQGFGRGDEGVRGTTGTPAPGCDDVAGRGGGGGEEAHAAALRLAHLEAERRWMGHQIWEFREGGRRG